MGLERGKSFRMTATNTNTATILAVDDDSMVLRLLEEVLRSAGYNVLTADGGRKAIRVYEDLGAPIHLLLTDVIMPDLTGPVLAERLRTRQPDLQVLFISGFHDADLVQRFAGDHGISLLPKPFTANILLREVQLSLRSAA
ncbi:MAG: response regulator [Acidobacteria bacterium]|nr:response regulator [Acidobacteriota bacterium]